MKKGLLTLSGLAMLAILSTSGIKKVDSANGKTGSTSGCGGCHGTTTGTITLTGIGTKVQAKKVYSFGLTYAAGASYKYWGLDLKCSVGTLTAGTGEKLSGTTELTHSAPLAYTGTTYVFPTMKWTAPTTLATGTAVKFSYATVAGSSTGTTGGPCQAGTFTTTGAVVDPVEFASFNAAWLGHNKVSLTWKTATEINTDHFEVERSVTGDVYTVVAKLDAAGKSESLLSYSSTDEIANATSTVYYRIKAFDKDGSYTYSEVRTVNMKPVKSFVKGMYPNPSVANQPLHVEYVSTEISKVKVELYNCLGTKMNSLSADVNMGENDIKFNLGRFISPGIYYVVVTNGNEKIAQLPVSVQ